MFNIDEPDQNKPTAEQVQQDKATVTELLQYALPGMTLSDVKPFHLGSHTATKNRPIQVALQNIDVVRNMIKSSNLGNSRHYKSIVISQDHTIKQVEFSSKNSWSEKVQVKPIFGSSTSTTFPSR
nr:unnamed protein product [Callosobruchus analis]